MINRNGSTLSNNKMTINLTTTFNITKYHSTYSKLMQDPEKILRSFESPLTFTEIQRFQQLFLLFDNIKKT